MSTAGWDTIKVGTSEFLTDQPDSLFESFYDSYGSQVMSLKDAEVAFKQDSMIPYRVLQLHYDKNRPYNIYKEEHLVIVIQEV